MEGSERIDINTAIRYNRPEWGRRMIMTDEKAITSENIEPVVSKAFFEHQGNAARELFLFNYDAGIQPINDREKDIRPEINVKVCDNMAAKIVNTHANYCFARPVTFVQRAKVELKDGAEKKSESDGDKDDTSIAILNKMNQEQKKGSKDFELARNFLKCGVGYMMAYPCREKRRKRQFSPFELMVLNPLTTFVIYSNDAYREPMVAVTYFIHEDGTVSLTAYTENFIYEAVSIPTDTFQLVKNPVPNILGVIPVVEFSLWDRTSIFERAIPLMDALNTLNSDRVNSVVQFVQSLLWLHNCEIDSTQKKKLVDEDGVIMTRSSEGREAKITYLTQTLNQSEEQTFVDYLKQEILELTTVPSWQEASGGSTTGAMQLSNGWQSLEINANAIEQRFAESEMQLLEVELAIIKNDSETFGDLKSLETSDIEIKFCRSKNYDLVSKTNALVSLINIGVDGLAAFNTVNLFTDSQQVWVDSKPMIEALQKRLIETPQNGQQAQNPGRSQWNATKDEEGNGGENNEPKDKTEESMQPSKVAQVEE